MSDSAPSRWVALIGALIGERRVTQTDAFPLDPEKMLPVADVVLMVADGDRGAMLFRYTAHEEFGGDTWHPTVAAALDQAADEYGDAILAWMQVPADVADAHDFAVQYAYERLDKRGDW
ncbi:MAG: hypothetical protein M3303_11665 [Gemmatimonadota bacterium]|nr:hypothetical protein [Gemmatimonadota bacterium]